MDATLGFLILGSVTAAAALVGIWFRFRKGSEKKPRDNSVSVEGGGAAAVAGRDQPTIASEGSVAIGPGHSGPITVIQGADEARLKVVEEQLKELQEKLASSPQGAADIGTEELAKAAGPNTEARLREALELQAQHKEREAIDALYEAFRKDLEPRAKAQLHVFLGNSFFKLSELVEAEGHYRQALDASRAAKLREGEAAALGNLGLVYADRGDLKRAEEHYRQSVVIAREIGNRLVEANALGNLGVVYNQRGDLERAEEHQKQALAISREIKNRLGEANSLCALGLVYKEQGTLEQAEEHYEQALVVHRETGNRLGEAATLGNLGNVYRKRGDLGRAEEHHQKALAIDREIGNRLGEAEDLGSLGILAAKKDQRDEACRLLKEAAAIYEKIGAGGPGPDTVRAALQAFGCE